MIKSANDDIEYVFDLDAIMNWITSLPKREQSSVTTITLTYPIVQNTEGNSEEPIQISDIPQKETSETKSSQNDTINNIRYDLIKNFIVLLTQEEVVKFDELSFGGQLIFNTFLKYKLIIPINSNLDEDTND